MKQTWHNFYYDVHGVPITNNLINVAVEEFWIRVLSIYKNDRLNLAIQFKIQLSNFQFRSISRLQIIRNDDSMNKAIKDLFFSYWIDCNEYYNSLEIINIVLSYKFLNLLPNDSNIKLLKQDKIFNNKKNKLVQHNILTRLPNTMNLEEWGTIMTDSPLEKLIISKNQISTKDSEIINNDLVYIVNVFSNRNEVIVKSGPFIKHTFVDYWSNRTNDKNKGSALNFIRVLDKKMTYYYNNGKVIFYHRDIETNFIRKTKKDYMASSKYITLDIETRTLNNGVMEPYCICLCIPKNLVNSIYEPIETNIVSFYLSDYKDSEDMIKDVFKFLMRPKYSEYKIYVHNFSHFDAIFLLKTISEISSKIKPVIRDSKIIELKIHFGKKNKYYFTFRDSYLLLPKSLRELGQSFSVNEQKSHFPYEFVNKVGINYIGSLPPLDYYPNLTKDEYLDICNGYIDNWNIRDETIKYCSRDCISLFEIVTRFRNEIMEMFDFDISRSPTLPSLALGIYRSNFLQEECHHIPIITGKAYSNLVQGYLGGHVDVYQPIPNKDDKIYHYDVNSLYPYVMAHFPMPTGKPKFFYGDIRKNEYYAFGFFYVRVTAPDDIRVPILLTRINRSTIAPIGTWEGMYFSEELYNAESYGYKFEIIFGYIFEKSKNLFADYIKNLYTIKKERSSKDAKYIISKMLMNSLYGRFGMNPYRESHQIVDTLSNPTFYQDYDVNNVIDLSNGKELVSFLDFNKQSDFEPIRNISIVIAMAISAYGRIHMSQFKNKVDYDLYYTDTDSIFINKPLPISFIDDKMGSMKLENIFDEAIFIAPKVYGGVISNNVTNLNETILVIRGLKLTEKESMNYFTVKEIMKKEGKITLTQDKWHRDISNSTIKVTKELFTIMKTDNKRKIIYDEITELPLGTRSIKL